jgi:hypothetical protein
MGKGIAKTFKDRHPAMFREYRNLCLDKQLDVGRLHLWKSTDRWILNFPTKTTWRQPSQLSYVERGLKTFVENYEAMGVVSVSFPPLGCGNGNLDWHDVKPLMESYLNRISIPVYVHSLHVGQEFIPEHKESDQVPGDISQFLRDLTVAMHQNKGAFFDPRGVKFFAQPLGDEIQLASEDGAKGLIFREELVKAWVTLRDGLLLADGSTASCVDDQLASLLLSLPYVRSVEVSRSKFDQAEKSLALYFSRSEGKPLEATGESVQGCLSL